MLAFFTILIMLAVGYALLREGIFTAFLMLCNVVMAGLVTFNFYEPLADLMEDNINDTFRPYSDAVVMVALFCVTLGLLRLATNAIANTEPNFIFWVRRSGGFFFGMCTGYLVSGFLLCVLQTLPWSETFLGFVPPNPAEPRMGMSRVLPPDLVWLAMMHRAGGYAFANNLDELGDPTSPSATERYLTFDKGGTFEIRYERYRRYGDKKPEPLEYYGELEIPLRKTGL
jgi:uncharacterized membrane protein required for colicin V production